MHELQILSAKNRTEQCCQRTEAYVTDACQLKKA